MSFYRVGQNKRKKPSIPKRPGWDDSVHDLTVYRATPEEVFLRKEAHKSKNHISVKLEKLRKERQKTKFTGAEAKQLAIMKEVLYDQHELQKVLAKSDTMMEVVKDLFGDDPKRFMGFPNVTNAPQAAVETNISSSLVASVPDIYTRTEKLSDSVMNQFALNDVQSNSESEFDSEEEDSKPQPISYQSQLNLQKFRDYLQEEEKLGAFMDPPSLISQLNKEEEENRMKDTGNEEQMTREETQAAEEVSAACSDMQHGQMIQLLTSLLDQGKIGAKSLNDTQMLGALITAAAAKESEDSGFKTPPKANHSPHLPHERPPPSAINDTKKLKKAKKCTKSTESHTDSNSMNSSASMSNMRQVLQELENDIKTYELQTGRRPEEDSNKTETFSGYTIALVSAVSKLTKYLKDTDLRVRAEVTLREQLTQDVYQLRTIIDALATDIILTQEEYGKLYSEHQRYKDNTTAALTSMNNQIHELRRLVMGSNQKKNTEQHEVAFQQLNEQQQQPVNVSGSTTKCDTSMTSTPLYNQQDSSIHSGSSSYKPLPAQVLPTSSIAAAVATTAVAASAALMLSPPIQKTRVQTNNGHCHGSNQSKTAERHSPLVDISNLLRHDQYGSMDPPHLTQVPPTTNTVNVPKPIPLVQTNVNVALHGEQCSIEPSSKTSQPTSNGTSQFVTGFTSARAKEHSQQINKSKSNANGQVTPRDQTLPVGGKIFHQAMPGPDLTDLVKLGDETEEQLNRLQELAVEEAMNNPALQQLMQTQIAELNRQQEEARQRLLDLLDKQKMQQTRIQQHFQDPQTEEAPSSTTLGQSKASRHQSHYSQVSPPISPISQKPEENPQSLQSRGLVVSLPMVDLDISAGSVGSAKSSTQPFMK